MANHSLGSINTYVTLTLYYLGLFFYIDLLSSKNQLWIYMSMIYPLSDLIILVVCYVKITYVKKSKLKLEAESEEKYQKTKGETEEKLKEIMYLPIEYESDVADDEDD
jgi:hypothetical protein